MKSHFRLSRLMADEPTCHHLAPQRFPYNMHLLVRQEIGSPLHFARYTKQIGNMEQVEDTRVGRCHFEGSDGDVEGEGRAGCGERW